MKLAGILPLAALMALSLPAQAQARSAPVSDELCFALLADPAANIDDPDARMLATMMVGYFTAKVRARIGPRGDLDATLKRGVDQYAGMNDDEAKEARNACLTDDMLTEMSYPFTVVNRMREGSTSGD